MVPSVEGDSGMSHGVVWATTTHLGNTPGTPCHHHQQEGMGGQGGRGAAALVSCICSEVVRQLGEVVDARKCLCARRCEM